MHQVQHCGLCRELGHNKITCEKCIICGEYGHDDEQCPLFYSALRKHELNRIVHNSIQVNIPDKCPICYIHLKKMKIVTTICGHTFCEDCILSHIHSEYRYSKYCPICRANLIKSEYVHKIFQLDEKLCLLCLLICLWFYWIYVCKDNAIR